MILVGYPVTSLHHHADNVLHAAADFADLLDMVSISTLFAFWIVALALIWYRGYVHRTTPPARAGLLAAHMLLLIGCSLGKTQHRHRYIMML